MKRRPIEYSDAELAFVESRRALPRVEIHAAFVAQFGRDDVKVRDLKNLCTRRGWSTRTRWSSEEDALLRERYPDTPTARLAAELHRKTLAVYQRAQKLGLHKSEAYRASPDACRLRRGDNVGAEYRFQKGQTPANKGVKRPAGWAPGRMRTTQFQKGQRSGVAGQNWMPVGSERVIDGYRYTKVSDIQNVPYTTNWKPLHRVRWEALHGPVADGMALKSVDGNRLNTDPENWQLVSRAMLPRLIGGRHQRQLAYDRAPAELKPTIMAVARLEHAARSRKKAVAS